MRFVIPGHLEFMVGEDRQKPAYFCEASKLGLAGLWPDVLEFKGIEYRRFRKSSRGKNVTAVSYRSPDGSTFIVFNA